MTGNTHYVSNRASMETMDWDEQPNREFELGGVNHLALVCRDMARTVDFYSGVLGMPLVKTIQLPVDMGQHFFFDAGGGNCIAFFWFPKAPEPQPGVSAAPALPDRGAIESAIGSMNHVALKVPSDRIEEYRDKLMAKGVDCSTILNHDDSEWGVAKDHGPEVFVRSVYFFDPDGILLEFAAWTRHLSTNDVNLPPAAAIADVTVGAHTD